MKKILKQISFVALLAFGLSSCENSSSEPIIYEARELRIVLGGEFIEVNQELMSRAGEDAGNKTYVGINVYRKTVAGYDEYKPCAYGVFDNLSDIVFNIQPDFKYKFECTTLKEDHDELAIFADGLSYPFVVNMNDKYSLDNLNKFVNSQSSTNKLVGLGRGTATVSLEKDVSGNTTNSEDVTRPSMLRFYGELEDYSLDNAGETINIQLKMASLGVKVVAENIPDGELTWEDLFWTFDFKNAVLTPTNTEVTHIFTLDDVNKCWSASESQEENCKLKFTWKRNSSTKEITTDILTLKRNVMTILKVTLDPGDKDMQFKLSEEAAFESTEEKNIVI